ncbi:MAG: ABC transporter ATP-binding protein, partial [Flavobacterium psychrophilum]
MIRIENLTKSYKTPKGKHYVFKNLSVELPSDKSVALIGRNGAGKSTLLRMIGGIDRPDSGRILTNKTISWPVGLAGGFQGSLTGRENVKFVSRLYARKDEIREKVEFVEAFAEIGKYFDMPIKTYSSGMRSRLGFGLSMAFKFDYYLVDEVTAVGDA